MFLSSPLVWFHSIMNFVVTFLNLCWTSESSSSVCFFYLDFWEHCTFPPNRCTTVLHHFVINCYFILCQINLSTNALLFPYLVSLSVRPETSWQSGKVFHHFVNKDTLGWNVTVAYFGIIRWFSVPLCVPASQSGTGSLASLDAFPLSRQVFLLITPTEHLLIKTLMHS